MPDITDFDVERVTKAAKELVDGRYVIDNPRDRAECMVTLEHCVAVMLIAMYEDPRDAATMLNESLVPGIEERLAMFAAKKGL